MKKLLEPIHKWQKMSESTHASLHYVYPRWIQLHAHLMEFSDPANFCFVDDIRAYLTRKDSHGFEFRLKRQVQDVHILAYILDPNNYSKWKDIIPTNQERVTEFLSKYSGSEVLEAFFYYVNQEEGFHTTKQCWKHVNNPKLFWNLSASISS